MRNISFLMSAFFALTLPCAISNAVLAALPQGPTPVPIAATTVPQQTVNVADLQQRIVKVEEENARLRLDIASLRGQLDALTESYTHHYHQVNGVVGDGIAFVNGKALVTGTYVDSDLRRTGTPQPPFHAFLLPPTAGKAATPVKPKAAKPKPGAAKAK